MKIYYPRHRFDGSKPATYDADLAAFMDKLTEVQELAYAARTEQGDFYDRIKYLMPDNSVWELVINAEWGIYYSLEEVEA